MRLPDPMPSIAPTQLQASRKYTAVDSGKPSALTIQQGYSQTIQRPAEHSQRTEGLGTVPEDELPLAQKKVGEIRVTTVQRSTKWDTGTVHETLNEAVNVLTGGAPITWHMLNGSKLSTDSVAEGAIKLPTVTTSGSEAKWTAKVNTVPEQTGSFDETVLAAGPWSTVATKAEVGSTTGLAACTAGKGNSTFSVKGNPSDDAVYKANRRHEDHHAADHKVAFNETIGAWDKKVQEAKDKGTEFNGTTDVDAVAALWAGVGGTPKKVAKDYRGLGLAKGGAFHLTTAGGPMTLSNPVADADCSNCSLDVTNPS
jgi:hypothetical protein